MKENYQNQIYGNLKAIEKSFRKPNAVYWKFECLLCGREHIANISDVRRGKIKSCGCKKNSKEKNGQWKGIGEMPGRYFSHYKKSAKSRSIEFSITLDDMYDVYIRQNKKCVYTGIELNISAKATQSRTANNASLDRIDSNKGYLKDNIQWVYKPINKIKNTLSHEEFINLCSMVAKMHDERQNV